MDLTIQQKKKHLLLLNKLYRSALKEELIPTPSKLSEDKVESLFTKLFMKKDNFFVPKVKNQYLVIDENEFKKLIPKTKQPKEKVKKQEPKLKEEPKKEEKEENFDDLSSKLQKLILLTKIEDIIKVLVKLGYKGRIQNNKMLMTLQILQNFNTIDKMKNLIKALEENKK
jgi:hypothetical protein